ncbi:MAG TPA: cytochrome c [Acidobacteriaceae bacterium]|jgi:mono/diheme cytochrome c family protein|nr:cytochrome c [Acidobacteriaceae bacterium]
MKFFLGLLIGFLIVPVGVAVYLKFGHPPVAVADHPFPFERQIVHVPLNARIKSEMPASGPLDASAPNLAAGAQIYRESCAACHGVQGHGSDFGARMYPRAPQLWSKHRNGVIGVSDDPVGETYWKVANGIRLSGMPSFDKILSQAQMWQVSELLKNADQPLPAGAAALVSTPLDFSVPNTSPPASH